MSTHPPASYLRAWQEQKHKIMSLTGALVRNTIIIVVALYNNYDDIILLYRETLYKFNVPTGQQEPAM